MSAQVESLSVGIVTHNHAGVIERTLRSVLATLPIGLAAEVWVLDNASTDGSRQIVERVAAGDSRVKIVVTGLNEGFGRGHNRILRMVGSTYHVFLNPDVTMTPGAFDALVACTRSDPRNAIVCPKVHFEDGRVQTINRREPTLLDLFLARFIKGRLRRPFDRRMRRYRMEDVGYDTAYDVPFVSGAIMFCRTEAVNAVGGFDDRYFLYFEDADLSRTIRTRGWKTRFCPDASVFHAWQRSSHHSYLGMFYFCVSAWKYFNKWGWRVW